MASSPIPSRVNAITAHKGGMRVLTTGLSDTRQVPLDVTRIPPHPIERRCQQQHQLGVAAHEIGAHGVLARSARRGLRRTGEDRPRLGQRVELALIVLHRPQGRAIVEIGATIPVTVPGQFEHPREPTRLIPISTRQVVTSPSFADGGKVVQHRHEEPSQPHALATAAMSDAVHPIVPVAGTNERKTVRAVLHRVRDRTYGMFEERGGLRRHVRQEIRFVLVCFE